MKEDIKFVWVDLEMTGLDPATDVILEIATIITDTSLVELAEGPNIIIGNQIIDEENLAPAVKVMHTESGLLAAAKKSSITLSQAQEQTMEFITAWCKPGTSLLCGNTIWQDRGFLKKYMPQIINHLHYRLIDVTSIKEIVKQWYPTHPQVSFKKDKRHRALDDIRESIAELLHYRRWFFVPYNL